MLLLRKYMIGRTSSSLALRGRMAPRSASLELNDLQKNIFHTVWHSDVQDLLTTQNVTHHRLGESSVIYRSNPGLKMSDFYQTKVWRMLRHHIKFLFRRKLTAEDWNVIRLQ